MKYLAITLLLIATVSMMCSALDFECINCLAVTESMDHFKEKCLCIGADKGCVMSCSEACKRCMARCADADVQCIHDNGCSIICFEI